jgi:hypothetical protein
LYKTGDYFLSVSQVREWSVSWVIGIARRQPAEEESES